MRDAEFAKTFNRISLRLEKFFQERMRKPIAKGDKALMAEDLVQLTAMMALENSRKEEYVTYPIEELLFEKANNVWSEYTNPPKKKFASERLAISAEEASAEPDPLKRLIMAEDIQKVHSMADEIIWQSFMLHEEGYSYQEIAKQMDDTEENLRQKISRLRAKIKARWKNRGYL